MTDQTVGDLLGRCLLALGARRAFGSADSGVRAIPGLSHIRVDDADLAVLLADADGRLGNGPGVALLPDLVLHLGSQPGAPPGRVLVDEVDALPAVLAGWSLGSVFSTIDIELGLDLDAPAPAGVEPIVLQPRLEDALVLSPSLAELRALVLAGPGVVRDGQVEALRSFAEQAGVGVVNTWGAKGVFKWDSPYHLGTAGLQARDFELAGFGDAELVIATGVDPLESPAQLWSGGQVLEVEPWQLATLAWRWEQPDRVPERPALYRELSAALAPHYASDEVPLDPARAAAGVGAARPDGGLVVADPGPAGLWVARCLPTTELASVVVPAHRAPGFAAAAAVVAALDERPVVGVVVDPPDETTLALLGLADDWQLSLSLEVWGADAGLASADDHAQRLAGSFAEPGVKVLPTPVALDRTRVLVDVAGEVIAWTGEWQ